MFRHLNVKFINISLICYIKINALKWQYTFYLFLKLCSMLYHYLICPFRRQCRNHLRLQGTLSDSGSPKYGTYNMFSLSLSLKNIKSYPYIPHRKYYSSNQILFKNILQERKYNHPLLIWMLAVDSRVGPEQILNDAKRKNSSLLYLHNTIEGAESRKRDMEIFQYLHISSW